MSEGIEKLFDKNLVMKIGNADDNGLCMGINLNTSTPINFYPANYHPVEIEGWESLPLYSR